MYWQHVCAIRCNCDKSGPKQVHMFPLLSFRVMFKGAACCSLVLYMHIVGCIFHLVILRPNCGSLWVIFCCNTKAREVFQFYPHMLSMEYYTNIEIKPSNRYKRIVWRLSMDNRSGIPNSIMQLLLSSRFAFPENCNNQRLVTCNLSNTNYNTKMLKIP